MKKLSCAMIAVLFGMAGSDLVGQPGTLVGADTAFVAEKEQVDKLPEGMMGFRGTFSGKVVSKDENKKTFVVKVTEIKRIWKENQAKDPKSAVGKSLRVEVAPKLPHHVERVTKAFGALKPGDHAEIEAFPNDEGRLICFGWLKKVE